MACCKALGNASKVHSSFSSIEHHVRSLLPFIQNKYAWEHWVVIVFQMMEMFWVKASGAFDAPGQNPHLLYSSKM